MVKISYRITFLIIFYRNWSIHWKSNEDQNSLMSQVEDVICEKPDHRSIMTYVSQFIRAFGERKPMEDTEQSGFMEWLKVASAMKLIEEEIEVMTKNTFISCGIFSKPHFYGLKSYCTLAILFTDMISPFIRWTLMNSQIQWLPSNLAKSYRFSQNFSNFQVYFRIRREYVEYRTLFSTIMATKMNYTVDELTDIEKRLVY